MAQFSGNALYQIWTLFISVFELRTCMDGTDIFLYYYYYYYYYYYGVIIMTELLREITLSFCKCEQAPTHRLQNKFLRVPTSDTVMSTKPSYSGLIDEEIGYDWSVSSEANGTRKIESVDFVGGVWTPMYVSKSTRVIYNNGGSRRWQHWQLACGSQILFCQQNWSYCYTVWSAVGIIMSPVCPSVCPSVLV